MNTYRITNSKGETTDVQADSFNIGTAPSSKNKDQPVNGALNFYKNVPNEDYRPFGHAEFQRYAGQPTHKSMLCAVYSGHLWESVQLVEEPIATAEAAKA